ncbi:MAG: malonyl-CoA decarboxylase [Hyphomicrobiaceae bacterium]
MNVSFLQEMMNTLAEQSRALLPKSLFGSEDEDNIEALSRALISGRGEASGVAIARQLLNRLKSATPEERKHFYTYLAEELQPDQAQVRAAAEAYLAHSGPETLRALHQATVSPRREFFRRLNLAPGATAELVALRHEMLRLRKSEPAVSIIDADLERLLQTWFNRGFLVLRRIDWQTPAAILEKIIAYEAVHEIKGWDDLRRRLDPMDRRCFAFFHPSLVDEPLIFVEVALASEVPDAIEPLLEARRGPADVEPTTAVFYSISNCQDGLKGISFGNFLLKQVVEELVRELPSLKTFVTLSPVPHFARWLDRAIASGDAKLVSPQDREILAVLRDPRWTEVARELGPQAAPLRTVLLQLAAHYFLLAKSSDQRPVDPVARFHLGNGARLERINWLADTSEKGLREAHGLMVNYRYELSEIEKNHEAYAADGTVAAARAVRALLKAPAKQKTAASGDREPVAAAEGTLAITARKSKDLLRR